MPKESKVFSTFAEYDTNGIVYQRESFGWELNSVSDNRVAMHRETTIPNYHKLTQYERDYNKNLELYMKYKSKTKYGFGILLLLIILFVLPGVLYIVYKEAMKNKTSFYLTELERIASESRTLYFSTGNDVLS